MSLYRYWRRYWVSATGKSIKRLVFQYNQKEALEWHWAILAFSFKSRIVSLNISCSGYILHIPRYQVVKFDCADGLLSRNIGLEPFQSQPLIVYSFCLGVVTSQHIHFHGSSPPTDRTSLYTTYIGCILHALSYIDEKYDGQHSHFGVNRTVQPCFGWLLPRVTCLPTYLF